MDYEKLIEQLKGISNGFMEDEYPKCANAVRKATTALSTLQAENKKLRTELKTAEMELDSLLAEGETVAFDPFGAEKED